MKVHEYQWSRSLHLTLSLDFATFTFLTLKAPNKNCSRQHFNFYAPPQKVAGYYVIPSELLSVCPSVRPSVCPSVRPSAVEHSCPVHNFDTVRDNFTKLGTNVKHDQTTCRD